jgi:hypothetical protein
MSRSMAFICEHLRASLLLREQFGVSSALASTTASSVFDRALRYIFAFFGSVLRRSRNCAVGSVLPVLRGIVVKSTSTARASSVRQRSLMPARRVCRCFGRSKDSSRSFLPVCRSPVVHQCFRVVQPACFRVRSRIPVGIREALIRVA